MNDNGAQAPIDPNAAVNTTEPATEPTDPNDPNAPIEIIVTDGNNSMAFKIRKNTKMGKMMARYVEHHDRNRATMRFLFDGDKLVDGDTPASVSALQLATFVNRADKGDLAGDGGWKRCRSGRRADWWMNKCTFLQGRMIGQRWDT